LLAQRQALLGITEFKSVPDADWLAVNIVVDNTLNNFDDIDVAVFENAAVG